MEALSVIGGALLTTTFQWLLTKLDSSQLLNFAKQEQVGAELKSWRGLLLKIRAVVEDAEEKQISDPLVKIWLEEVRDLAFDMDDLLHEFPLVALPEARTNVIRACFNTTVVKQNGFSSTSCKMKDVTDRLRRISAEVNALGLNLVTMAGDSTSNKLVERMPSTSLVEPHDVCGRENEKDEILRRLLITDGDGVDLIPIVGMGGIGKTTLAQLVYNDERVSGGFDLKAWVCVSERFDVLAVTRLILEKVTNSNRNYCWESGDLDSLQVKLKEELSGKKFVFVFDDVWSENYHQWDLFRRPFTAGAAGSKIIVTTRHCNVASMMGNVPAYQLQALRYDECLSVFAQHALGQTNFNSHPNVKDIGEEIVKRCKGLPLAAKTLGGLLRSRPISRDEWETVLNSKLWDLPEEGNAILPVLRLSYHHLPSYLKQCFAYCAVFPKGYEFDKDELVFLWMAEGLVRQQPDGMKLVEDLGHEYLRELLSRAFFQQAASGKGSRFVMHDLLNDLAQFVAGQTCCNFTHHKVKHDISHASFGKVRYFSFTKRSYDTSQRLFAMSYNMTSLRTFLPFSPFSPSFRSFLSNDVLYNLLPKLRYLRALSLCDYNIKKLPGSIEDLKHLRYLNLSRCLIQCLPESLTSLFYLQTLILHGCNKLTKLPVTIGNLVDLRHLDISETPALKEIPCGIGTLRRLLMLPKFVVGKAEADGLRIRQLNGLSQLRGELSILKLHNVSDVQDVREANLNEKEGLEELALEWTSEFHDHSRDEAKEVEVLSWLKPHHNLKKLAIKFYGAKEFPSWIGDPLFSNVTHLELIHCRRLTSLPWLGQLLSLKILILEGMVAVKTVGFTENVSSSIDAFPSLKMLKFENMSAWEEWFPLAGNKLQTSRHFPRLRQLHIYNCPKLVGKLPSYLPSLVKLEIHKCPKLTYSLVSLPSLKELHLGACNEVIFRSMVCLTRLRTLKITNIPHLSCLPNGFKQEIMMLEDVKIEECSELTSLWEDGTNIDNLVCLNRIVIKKCPLLGFFRDLDEQVVLRRNPEILELHDCNNLKRLPGSLLSLSSLRILRIKGCKALKSLNGIMKIDGGSSSGSNSNMRLQELKIRNCPSLKSFPRGKLPPTIKKLVVEDCELLRFLPDGLMSDDDSTDLHLQELIIRNCPLLESFPKGKSPNSLKTLRIEDCKRLQSLPGGMVHVEDLRLQGLSSFMSFPNGQLPKTLKRLTIFNCKRLESFPDRMLQHSKELETLEISHCTTLKTLPLDCFGNVLTRLCTLVISGCDKLESFPEARMFSTPKLQFLRINRCKNLKSLPSAIHNLKSLKELKVKGCPKILSIPEGGLPPNPPNLAHLFVDCENLKEQAIPEWGLDRLNSLRELWVHRLFPHDIVLPTALVELYIRNVADLKSLPGRLLKSLSSLKVLDISRCYQLQTLPKEGLPPSLRSLRIEDCPLLQNWCLENRRSIAHVPCLWIG